MKLSRTYRKWDSMMARCTRPSHPAFKYYGALGITVCAQWRNYEAFLADMGEAPEGLWLDRIDNATGYQPGNCRWVTPKESAANRRKVGPSPRPGSLRQKAKRVGLPYSLVYQRIMRGWPEGIALSAPIQPRGGMKDFTRRELGLRVG